MIRTWLSGVVFAGAVACAAPVASETKLLMFDQAGCHWCAQWDAEIAPIYPHTDEARIAPLARQDIHDPLPAGVNLTTPPQFTPTFVLIEDGHEVGRIEGYPGEDFFWGLLDRLIARLPEENDA